MWRYGKHLRIPEDHRTAAAWQRWLRPIDSQLQIAACQVAIKVAQFNTLVTIRDRVLQKIALAMYVHLSPANNPNLLWFFSMHRELGTIWDLPMQCSDRTCNRCTDSE